MHGNPPGLMKYKGWGSQQHEGASAGLGGVSQQHVGEEVSAAQGGGGLTSTKGYQQLREVGVSAARTKKIT